MASRSGSLLERSVVKLLKLSGFQPELNKIVNSYEIDVLLQYKHFRIAFECKQYERSALAIRNLIHQWDSKNKELHFDKIVLILIGCDISQNDYALAKKYNISIWGEEKLESLLDKAIHEKEKNKSSILKELNIKFEKNESKDEIKMVETEQQKEIKKVLEKLQNKGKRRPGHSAFAQFVEPDSTFFVPCSLHQEGMMLSFATRSEYGHHKGITTNHLENISSLLKSMNFKLNNEVYVLELKQNEFSFEDNEIYAQCGEDLNMTSHLIDIIFREIFKSNERYKLEIELALNG